MIATVNSLDLNTYRTLLGTVLPTSIQNETDHERILGEIEKLFDKHLTEKPLSLEEEVLLELLSTLVEAYESKIYSPEPPAKPHEILQTLMKDRNLRQRDLLSVLGSRSLISEIINGKRIPTKQQAKALGEFFRMSPDLFRKRR